MIRFSSLFFSSLCGFKCRLISLFVPPPSKLSLLPCCMCSLSSLIIFFAVISVTICFSFTLISFIYCYSAFVSSSLFSSPSFCLSHSSFPIIAASPHSCYVKSSYAPKSYATSLPQQKIQFLPQSAHVFCILLHMHVHKNIRATTTCSLWIRMQTDPVFPVVPSSPVT